jgi:hypothetical protein
MKRTIGVGMLVLVLAPTLASAQTQPRPAIGAEEMGMTQHELVQAIEKTEQQIARCMRDQGFQYIAADYNTVRAGMMAVKKLPGLSEEEYAKRHGYGISTLYTGLPPQLGSTHNAARVGLGERNVQIFRSLSQPDQVAYSRALFGEGNTMTFAVALDNEDLSRTGGCTRQAVGQVFKEDQLKASYYNPKDAMVRKDPRMKAAIEKWAVEMRKAGYNLYSHPDEIERDLRTRLDALTEGGKLLVDKLSPDQKVALKKLQDYERAVAVKSFKLQEKYVDPIEDRIEKELLGRKVQ